MSSTNIEVFCSGTFNFDIGQSKTRFTLHKTLVSRHSEPLDRLMHGGFQESQLGVGTLEDVEPETFARFAEYIYSGDYSSAEPKNGDAEDEQRGSGTEDEASSRKKTTHRANLTDQWAGIQSPDNGGEPSEIGDDDPQGPDAAGEMVFEAEEAAADAPAEGPPPDSPTNSVPPEVPYLPEELEADQRPFSPLDSPPPRSPASSVGFSTITISARHVPFQLEPAPGPNEASSADYSPVFMCHAQVYLFAQQYIIPDLKTLAASKLADSLNIFHCYSSRAGDIARLIEYVYSNTPDPDSTPIPLREVAVRYAANNFKILVSSTDFRSLLAEQGTFAPDLCRKVARML